MKIYFLILGILLFSFATQAQESTNSKKHNFEFSINASRIVNDIFSFNNRDVDPGPYIFQIKQFAGKTAFRLGLGGRYFRDKNNEDQFTVQEIKNTQLDARIGLERHVILAKRWEFYYGVDALFQLLNTRNEVLSDVDVFTSTADSKTYGAGPIFGIQFNISRRMSVWTEASIYYNYSRVTESDRSQSFPELFNTEIKRERQLVTSNLPVALFFAIKL